MRRTTIRAGVALVALALTPSATIAQESTSFRLAEHTFNAGGRPAQGLSAASGGFRVSLDALGASAGHLMSGSPSFGLDGGFVPPYRPPGEIAGLRFVDASTLAWDASASARAYNVYRDTSGALGGAIGTCQETGVADPSATDAELPPPATAFLYLVSGVNRIHEEGTLGSASGGANRIPAGECP